MIFKTELVEQCLLYFRSITHHLQVPPAKSESVLHSQSKRDFFNTIGGERNVGFMFEYDQKPPLRAKENIVLLFG
ncbi:hypothetical protein HK11_12435 [Acetobacter sp. DmW_043]|nr:hypothetical protein HK11_12435 [Acetobacter sp. DmW_043]